MPKIKISSITTALVVFLMFFVSCTNEELVPNKPDGPVLNQGRIVFNVNTGKNVVSTRVAEKDEQAIRSLGVFIVKPDGNLAEGVTRFYDSQISASNKLAVPIPVDIMETPGLKAYLVANGPDKAQCDGLKTEQEVLSLVATTKPEEISTKGIPMVTGAIPLNFTGGIATVDANMKRVMSTLYAKVVKSKGVVVGPSDFTFKVHGVSGKEGYCFKDECKDTGVDQVWSSTSKTQDEEVSLGYFYQSKAFQVEVVSQSTGQSRTVEIPLKNAQMRNKKYVLKIHPSKSSKGEFTVTMEAWKERNLEMHFDKLITFTEPNAPFEGAYGLWVNDTDKTGTFPPLIIHPLIPKTEKGFKVVSYALTGCLDEQKRGVTLERNALIGTPFQNPKEINGTLLCTLESENGTRIQESIPVHVAPPFFSWDKEFKQKTDDASFKVVGETLVCTVINDSARELSVDAKVLQTFGHKVNKLEDNGTEPDDADVGISFDAHNIKFTLNESFKGLQLAVLIFETTDCKSSLLIRFE